MELRRTADALLRCHASPLTALLSPAVVHRKGIQQLSQRTSILSQRTFTTTSPRLAVYGPTATTTSGPPKEPAKLESSAAKLGWLQPQKTDYASARDQGARFGARPRQSSFPSTLGGGDSADAILQMLSPKSTNPDLTKLNNPITERTPDLQSLTQELMPEIKKPKLRLSPATGRTVNIGGTIDVGRGFRLLEQSCARNKVRSDFTKQRFHERGGLKKKRLRRERWRKRFMEGFKATVQRVKELKSQGW